MEKPISIRLDEMKTKMVDAINSTELPMYLVEGPLKELLSEVQTVAAQQKRKEREAYEKAESEEE